MQDSSHTVLVIGRHWQRCMVGHCTYSHLGSSLHSLSSVAFMVRQRRPLEEESEERQLKRLAVSVDTLLRRALNLLPHPRYQTLHSDPLPVSREVVISYLESVAYSERFRVQSNNTQ